jgi:hypothetical protein
MEMLGAHGIRSRTIILSSDRMVSLHTLLEVRYEDAWGAVDPLYNIVYRHADGRPASLQDLRRDEALFLANAASGWQYGYGPERLEKTNAYNAGKNVFRNAHYFNFDKLRAASLALHRLLTRIGGEEGPLWVKRPNFYSYPGLTTLVLLDVGTLGLAGLALGWRRLASGGLRRATRAPRANRPRVGVA